MPNNEKEPVSREEVVRALREWKDVTPLSEYVGQLQEKWGETDEGRLHIEYEVALIYIEAGHFDEAQEVINGGIAMAQGANDPNWYDLFDLLDKDIQGKRGPPTSREPS